MGNNFTNIILLSFFLLLLNLTYGQYSNLMMEPESEGLYNKSDYVKILNIHNFNANVYNSNTSWLINFYSNWCGHCQRFAPVWRNLAKTIKHWQSIVRVAAVDCGNDNNIPICRDLGIMKYPMLKFFSVNSKPGYLGLEIENGWDVVGLQETLIDKLEIEKREGRGYSFPNIIPYSMTQIQNIWQNVDKNVNYIFLIFEEPNSIVGFDMIMHFEKLTNVHFGRALANDTSPLMEILQRNNYPMFVNLNNLTNDEIKKLIENKLGSFGISVEATETIENYTEINKPQNPNVPFHKFGDILFQLDLEKTLRYSLNHEIPLTMMIEGEKIEALKNYLNVLVSYFPMHSNGSIYLLSLQEAIKNRESISGETFRQFSSDLENQLTSIYSGEDKWIGCQGSSSSYRGFPCGLWTMFHMLTVNFANMDNYQKDPNPIRVLSAMHGYVKNFFGCADCSRHFLNMSEQNNIFQWKSADDSVLWLWRAHNEVNQRLAGDETEDPQHKKIQYPAKNDCPDCRDLNNNWIESNVLLYLKKKYSSTAVNFYGSSLQSKKLYYRILPNRESLYLFYYRR